MGEYKQGIRISAFCRKYTHNLDFVVNDIVKSLIFQQI